MRNRLFARQSLLLTAAFLGFAAFVHLLSAQTQPAPKITQVLPAGGQAGTIFDVLVTGTDMQKPEGLYFSFPGAKVEVAETAKAPVPDPKQKEPQAKKGGQPPQVAQKFKVTLPTNAPLGIHDVRVITNFGVSNPRAFVVGDLKEVAEKESNDDVDKAQKIELDSTVSGVILNPTDVDYFEFAGKKGQRVTVSCLTTSIDSRLPAQLQLYSASGAHLVFNRAYLNNDAVLDATLPGDGAYLVRLCSFTYTQGGPDYYYRLTVSTAPWIDAVFPNIVEPGKDAKITVFGRNLPNGTPDPNAVIDERTLEKATMTVKAPADSRALQRLTHMGFRPPTMAALDGFDFRVKRESRQSNPVLLRFAQAPVVLDNEANDTPDKAQKVSIPCEIAGRIEKKADRDVYAFAAKKGQNLAIEAFGDRFGAPVDLYFSLKDDKGNSITEQDDNPEIPTPQLFARSDDPAAYRLKIPADGTYQLTVSSRDAPLLFGPRHIYTVRIAPEKPDFRLVAMPVSAVSPDSVVLGQGGSQAYIVYVLRLGGFAGDIVLSGEKLPPGVTMNPHIIGGNQKQSAFVVSAAPEAPPWVGALGIIATATIDGQKVVREVRAATLSYAVPQQNVPAVSRLDRELVLALRDKAPYRLIPASEHISALQGDKISIPLKLLPGADFKSSVQVLALSVPVGMVMQPVTIAPGKDSITVNLDSKTTAQPGTYTVVLRGQTQIVNPKQPAPPKAGGPPNLVQAAPSITLTIVPRQLAKLSLSAGNVKVAAGKSTTIVVSLARQFNYNGPFKLEAVLPKDAKGLSVEPVTIKAGQDQGTLTVRTEPEAAGKNFALTIRATAMFNDKTPVVHEAKVAVSVTK